MEIVGHRHLDAIVKPVDASVKPVKRRSHKRSRPQLLTRATLDGRTNAAKVFDRLVADIESDLAGRDSQTATPFVRRRDLDDVVFLYAHSPANLYSRLASSPSSGNVIIRAATSIGLFTRTAKQFLALSDRPLV